MPTITTTTTRPQTMARHALSCRSCKAHVATITNSPGHLERQEALAAIEWCTYRRSQRKAHA